MVDYFLALAIQHYVVFGIVAIAAGVLLNLAFAAGPDIAASILHHEPN